MKKILFLTGTRADFGKLKSLINKVENHPNMESYIFITGMHMIAKYGMTANEVKKNGYTNTYSYINQNGHDSMDVILSKTIQGLSDYVKELKPDMLVIHGDRVEALAGAIVGSLNNILVSHIEGGEKSGTIDDLIRHSVSKMSHIHFVSNDSAKIRLMQLGELEESIYVIGSPDLDVMKSNDLPSIESVKNYYGIDFDEYSIVMFHPVTTELDSIQTQARELRFALEKSGKKFVVIYPNNDHGSSEILSEINLLNHSPNFKVFPSIRFESFLTLLKNAKCIIGNSSAGVREAPFYGLPSINIGTRQNNRAFAASIINVKSEQREIFDSIMNIYNKQISIYAIEKEFGDGNSDDKFIDVLSGVNVWQTKKQKIFMDRG
ncbi:UDP-N-acetyl glucosamine 2-epimerase [Shewanella sp. Pdp11]|uniref:UDP-N-acetylglucosamine 2-epimerase n=1 Tax=Shewanella sp. Pdp11 TaxID=2059264 RepID=UPI000CA2B08D|nr:UDP-N-acetylglucosamine 2-epimerase [Shewanella sp. Pdp11]AUD61027.1 UDP-N-acetyl glucosamine 2-epimerase [Shewanella sp. Pdp11]